MNFYLVSHMAALVLGYLSRQYNRSFRVILLLALPAAWLFAFIAPRSTSLTHANQDGFLNFYVKIYERLSPEAMMAVLLFPFIFMAGRFIHLVYETYFYREKTDTPIKRKKRVLASFGIR